MCEYMVCVHVCIDPHYRHGIPRARLESQRCLGLIQSLQYVLAHGEFDGHAPTLNNIFNYPTQSCLS